MWRRKSASYDHTRLGLHVIELDSIPQSITSNTERREYFDTRKYGKSRHGHDYPSALSEAEKRAVLEFLKTL